MVALLSIDEIKVEHKASKVIDVQRLSVRR